MSDLDDPVSSFEDDLFVSGWVVFCDNIGTLILNTVDNCEGRRGGGRGGGRGGERGEKGGEEGGERGEKGEEREGKERKVDINYRHEMCHTSQSELVTSQNSNPEQARRQVSR